MIKQQIDITRLPVAPSLHWFEEWATWMHNDEYKRGGGKLDEKSQAAYRASVLNFVRTVQTLTPSPSPLQGEGGMFDQQNVIRYFAYLEEQGTPAKTWNHRLTSLRKVVKWAMRVGYLHEDPTRAIERIHEIEAAPRRIEEAAYQRLEGVAVSGSHLKRGTELWSRLGLRDRVIWHLFRATLRLAEVTKADIRSINLDEGTIRVKGKGNVVGTVILTSEAVEDIGAWMAVRADLRFASSTSALLTDWSGKAITPCTVWRRYKQMCAAAGVKSSTHEMRHTSIHQIITALVRQDVPLNEAVKAAGTQARHRDARTTWGYMRVPLSMVRAAMEG